MDVDVFKGRANLKLNAITLADNKYFECRLTIAGDDEGRPADKTRLVVLGIIALKKKNLKNKNRKFKNLLYSV